MKREPIVDVGLLTETHLRLLGGSLKKVFPIPTDDRFIDLIEALDRPRQGHPPKRDAAHFRQQAAKCRWLASEQSDAHLRETLRTMAQEYDAQADDAGAPPLRVVR